jgi:hypothetical protein
MEQIEAFEHELMMAANFDFEILDYLPYGSILAFCRSHANPLCSEQLILTAYKFCNDSFKLPLCLYYHPKVIAAACIQSAMLFR